MQSLSYVGPSTWNKLPNNLKTATYIKCVKHDIKKYFLKKSSETEADIVITIKEKKLNQDKYTSCFFYLFEY